MSRYRNWIQAAFCMVLVLLCAGRAGAFPAIDTSQEVSLTVNASVESKAISGLRFTLFRVADMAIGEDGDAVFTLTDAFAAYGDEIEMNLDPKGMDSSTWAEGAVTLAPYVLRDSSNGTKTFETASSVTGEDGNAVFSGVSQGLYLMTASYEGNEYTSITVTPVFLTLPQLSEDQSSWIYDASAGAKVNVLRGFGTGEKTSVYVKKVWSGDDAAGVSLRRPESITVNLLSSDGTVVDTQTLSSSNGWAFTWTGLNEGEWTVAEQDVPSGYSVSQTVQDTTDGKAVTITNTTPPSGVQGVTREKTTPSTETVETGSGTAPASRKKTEKKTGSVKGSSRSGDTANETSDVRLPQTGQLWWPVWVLCAAAAVLLVIGLILRISGKRDLRD